MINALALQKSKTQLNKLKITLKQKSELIKNMQNKNRSKSMRYSNNNKNNSNNNINIIIYVTHIKNYQKKKMKLLIQLLILKK